MYTENITSMCNKDIEDFISNRVCYIKLPTDITEALVQIRNNGFDFFHLPLETKNSYQMENGNGYLNHLQDTPTNIQRYIYRDAMVATELKQLESKFNLVRNHLRHKIFEPLLQNIFALLELSTDYTDFTNNADQTISLIYYPQIQHTTTRLKAHKDISALTALWAPDEGLFSKIADEWIEATTDPSYIIVQIGKALELVTNQLCQGSEHYVTSASNSERLSIASFYSPNLDGKLTNYKTGEIITKKFRDVVKQHVKSTHEDD